jgi:Trk K+ transport system NAD-binding subunit
VETGGLYLVLGCGDVGFSIARRLKCRADVVIIERDEKKVEQLVKSLYCAAVHGDFGSPDVLRRAGIEQAEAVIITTRRDPQSTERALEAIGKLKAQLKISPLVLALVQDEIEVPHVKKLGADEALPSAEIIADFVLARLEELKSKKA